jgi:transposase, IS30 family
MPYNHFTVYERDLLQFYRNKEWPISEISILLDKAPSTIYRELKRNSTDRIYVSRLAIEKSANRRFCSKSSPVLGNSILIATVVKMIRQEVSPEQIAGRITLEKGHIPKWKISHESIYQYIYQQARIGNDLRSHLRHGRKPYCKRKGINSRRGVIPNRVFIDQRPTEVNHKTRIGDWEGDTIEGSGKKGYVATFTDRKTKFLIANKLKHKTAEELVRSAKRAFNKVPRTHLKTITLDNGREFARHQELSKVLNVDVFFAHPYHSWERGLNEHTNGLLRQYFPKKMNLLNLHKRELDTVVMKLNNRPRKILGYRTPHEVFFNLPLALQI